MNKGQHNTFKKLSPDFFSIELKVTFLPYYLTFSLKISVVYSHAASFFS